MRRKRCSDCGQLFERKDMMEVRTRAGWRLICSGCIESDYVFCERCDYCTRDKTELVSMMVGGMKGETMMIFEQALCPECRDDIVQCSACGYNFFFDSDFIKVVTRGNTLKYMCMDCIRFS